jgi:signal recognition particle subunit SEC65
VPKSLAVQSPKVVEIKIVVERLGLKHEFAPKAGYPKTPWLKTGMIMVEKKGSKEQVIRKIAEQLVKLRSESSKQR